MKKIKSQTATEYLIILAVVIIIALIVIGALGGIPFLGSGISENTARANLQTLKISVTNYAISDYDTTLKLKNNLPNSVKITNLYLDDEECINFTTISLSVGESKTVTCINVYGEFGASKADLSLNITYIDLQNYATYTQSDDGARLIGPISSKYLNLVKAHSTWNDSINGCFDSSKDPIPICTCYDLKRMDDEINSDYELEFNLDFIRCQKAFGDQGYNRGTGWEPVLSEGDYGGTINGQNHFIKNLYINKPADDYIGLFRYTTSGSEIKNIKLLNFDITGNNYVGSLIGDGEITIDNIYTNGIINGNSNVGGLIGNLQSDGIIKNSHINGVITGVSNVGGLTGSVGDTNYQNSYINARIYGNSNVGSIVGLSGGDGITFSGITWFNYTDDNANRCIGDDAWATNCVAIS